MLEVQGLSSGYETLQVLWDIDLTVPEGAWVALVGSAGSGKSTFMKAVAGLLPAFAGEVRFHDQDLTHLPAHERVRRDMALVPEGRRLFTGMTVEENVVMGGFQVADRASVSDHLSRVYDLFPILKQRRKQIVGTLSGGEQQMCAIARALMTQPKLLMVDELSLGLAPLVVDDLLETLSAIKKEGTTLLVIEQDVEIALTYANWGYILREGRIVSSGSADKLLADPNLQKDYLGI